MEIKSPIISARIPRFYSFLWKDSISICERIKYEMLFIDFQNMKYGVKGKAKKEIYISVFKCGNESIFIMQK
jgi:hypothetical protein